jgi:2'-5' RNA ligase
MPVPRRSTRRLAHLGQRRFCGRVTLDLEMEGIAGDTGGINSFALVSYLSDPLGAFLDRLRCELVPKCRAKAHITVLPPRPLQGPDPEAWRELKRNLQDFEPFRVELGGVTVFPGTRVIYLAVSAGYRELERMHVALNKGLVAFQEPFPYHPHITLAQDLAAGEQAGAFEMCQRQWREYAHPRSFTVDRLTFVQNTLDDQWIDLAGCALASPVAY